MGFDQSCEYLQLATSQAMEADASSSFRARTRQFPHVRIILAGVDPGLKKLRIEYPGPREKQPHQHRRASTRRLTSSTSADKRAMTMMSRDNSSHSSPESDQVGPRSSANDVDDDEEPSKPKVKTIWAITPGTGSIGDRYFRTD